MVLRARAVPSATSRPGEPATSTSSLHQPSGRHSSGWIIRTACTRGTGMVSATVPSRPRRIRMPSGDWARVKPYWVDTRRQSIEAPITSHHTTATPRAARPAGEASASTTATTAPASTATSAPPEADSSTEAASRPVGTMTATCSAGAGVAGSIPWWAASSRARRSSAACSVR